MDSPPPPQKNMHFVASDKAPSYFYQLRTAGFGDPAWLLLHRDIIQSGLKRGPVHNKQCSFLLSGWHAINPPVRADEVGVRGRVFGARATPAVPQRMCQHHQRRKAGGGPLVPDFEHYHQTHTSDTNPAPVSLESQMSFVCSQPRGRQR